MLHSSECGSFRTRWIDCSKEDGVKTELRCDRVYIISFLSYKVQNQNISEL